MNRQMRTPGPTLWFGTPSSHDLLETRAELHVLRQRVAALGEALATLVDALDQPPTLDAEARERAHRRGVRHARELLVLGAAGPDDRSEA